MKQSSLDEQEQLGMELEAQANENEENDMNEYYRTLDDSMNGDGSGNIDEAQLNKQNSTANEPPEPPQHPTLPWKPKVRTKDIYQFLDVSRRKFIGYSLQDNIETTAGLPKPICEGINILKKVRNHIKFNYFNIILYSIANSIFIHHLLMFKSNAKRKLHVIH
jgi:hypothetical protein